MLVIISGSVGYLAAVSQPQPTYSGTKYENDYGRRAWKNGLFLDIVPTFARKIWALNHASNFTAVDLNCHLQNINQKCRHFGNLYNLKKKFWEEPIAYFIWYDTDRIENEKIKEEHTDTQTARWSHKPPNKISGGGGEKQTARWSNERFIF
jgi:hypothetical protein